ncbi:MAG: hypothetical protein AABM29_02860 [Actinomycetota bacterium]
MTGVSAITITGVEPAFFFGAGGLVIAAIGLGITIARHRDERRERRARARFRVTLTPHPGRANWGGLILTEGNVMNVRVVVGIKNVGDRAAGATLVNVLVPDHLESVRWCGPNGEDHPDGPGSTAPASGWDVLKDGERDYPAKYLSRTIPEVGIKPHYALYFTFHVNVPDPGQGEARVPVRAKVQADEIPEDVDEYVEELVVRVARTES